MYKRNKVFLHNFLPVLYEAHNWLLYRVQWVNHVGTLQTIAAGGVVNKVIVNVSIMYKNGMGYGL